MSFLESIQHGLEKASKEAARITKIHHLQNVANDLSFKSAQEGQHLLARAMELHHNGQLPPELAEMCQQIITYQQQISEVQAEIQKLHEEQEEPAAPPAPPAPGGYAAYPPTPPAPGYTPQPYPPYPPSTAGYTGYQAAPPPYQSYTPPAPPASPSSEVPTKPGATATATQAPPASPSSEVPTKPGATPAAPKEHHKSKEAPKAEADETPASRGSYEEGALPPVFSPFANKPAPAPEAEGKKEK